MLVHIPDFSTDAEAEASLDQDLSGLDFSQFEPVRFAFASQVEQVTLDLPQGAVDAVEAPTSEPIRTDSTVENWK